MKLKLFIVSIIVLLSFVAYQKYSEYKTIKPITLSHTINQTEQIYKDEKYNFSFIYPSSLFYLSKSSDLDSSLNSEQITLLQKSDKSLPTFSDLTISISEKDNSYKISPSMQPYQLGDIRAYKEETVIKYEKGSSYWIHIIFQHLGKSFDIQSNFSNPPSQSDLNLVSQILSTFKFTN